MTVVAQQGDRVLRGRVIEGGAQGRISDARLIAAGKVPLLDGHPFARRDMVFGDTGLDERHQGVETDLAAVEAAYVQVGDAGGMDVRVHQARQHQPTGGVLDPRLGPDQGLGAARRADKDDLAVSYRQRLRGAVRSVDRIDPGVGQHEIGRGGGGERRPDEPSGAGQNGERVFGHRRGSPVNSDRRR